MYKAGVSVIICCFNSATRLPETLQHIAAQIVPPNIPWEVIIVDNASTDTTAIVAKQEWAKHNTRNIEFKIVAEPEAGLMHARKKGLSEASYEYLIFCDDDNWLYPNYISTAFETLTADPQIGVLGGCGIFEPEQPVWPGIEKFKSNYVNGSQHHAITQHWVYGAGSVYKKSILVNLYTNGWQQITSDRIGKKLISGGDVEICFMHFLIGYKIVADDRLLFKHFVPIKRQNEAYIIKMAFWQGYTNVLLDGYYRLVGNVKTPIQASMRAWYISAGKSLIKQYLLLAYHKIKRPASLSMDEKMTLQSSLGTFIALVKNRKAVVQHYEHVLDLLSSKKIALSANNKILT
jgi:glycosyltransferase involved in cell wall biosynthesis